MFKRTKDTFRSYCECGCFIKTFTDKDKSVFFVPFFLRVNVLWNTDFESVRRQAAVKTKPKLFAGFEPAFPSIVLTKLNYLVIRREWDSNPRPIECDNFLENHQKPPNQVA